MPGIGIKTMKLWIFMFIYKHLPTRLAIKICSSKFFKNQFYKAFWD